MEKSVISLLLAEASDLSEKLEAVRSVLRVYGVALVDEIKEQDDRSSASKPSNNIENATVVRSGLSLDRFSSYGASVIRAAVKCIKEYPSKPVPTRVLAELIEQDGLTIRGEDKVNALSALLARSAEVNSNGRRGWTIAALSPENGSSPGDAGDDPDTESLGVEGAL